MSLVHVSGDATLPKGPGPVVIVHCCNDIGAWGAGFVLTLSRRWPWPEREFRRWSSTRPRPQLGEVQFVVVEDEVMVANLIGQHGVRSRENPCPVSYVAIRRGLAQVAGWCLEHGASVQMPRIGAGLAGGNWDTIEQIVVEELVMKGVDVSVFTLGGRP